MDISIRVNKFYHIFGLLLFVGCSTSKQESKEMLITSLKVVGSSYYNEVYRKLSDSLDAWVQNKLIDVEAETLYSYKVDSLLCFNKDSSRVVGCRHLYINLQNSSADELLFHYGEKINRKWYFFRGTSVVIPRSMAKGHDDPTKPLSYQELHEIAIKEVFNGYLNDYGGINEDWFIQHFENVGICGECKTREDFQKNIIEGGAAKWKYRDTTQAIKLLPKKDTLIP